MMSRPDQGPQLSEQEPPQHREQPDGHPRLAPSQPQRGVDDHRAQQQQRGEGRDEDEGDEDERDSAHTPERSGGAGALVGDQRSQLTHSPSIVLPPESAHAALRTRRAGEGSRPARARPSLRPAPVHPCRCRRRSRRRACRRRRPPSRRKACPPPRRCGREPRPCCVRRAGTGPDRACPCGTMSAENSHESSNRSDRPVSASEKRVFSSEPWEATHTAMPRRRTSSTHSLAPGTLRRPSRKASARSRS